MEEQKIIAVVGLNASGKTMFIDRMRKQLASDAVRYIAFRDSYGVAVDGAYYLQLRWNQHDIDAETPTVGELLERAFLLDGADNAERRQWQQHLYKLFDLSPLLDKYIITLSSGELRKFQLTRTLLHQPRILMMDNPFIGLDAEAREQLRQLIRLLADEHGLKVYLILSKTDDMPDFVEHVIALTDGEAKEFSPEDYLAQRQPVPPHMLDDRRRQAILNLPANDNDYRADDVIVMRNVNIRYGERTILKDLTWTVRNGERWALSGQNGSGKSTLLSLVCADNPQSYACDISLFGFQRGSGESIWDIKKHIGYVSPEMHRSYQRDIPAQNIVASGLKDTVGLYVNPTAEEKERCRWWLDIFGIGHLAERRFLQLSSGEQRLVLLARAFVKDPELLILDEPLHGLDNRNRQLVKDIINTFCERKNKTFIMVTHYQEELPQCITHSLYLKKQQ